MKDFYIVAFGKLLFYSLKPCRAAVSNKITPTQFAFATHAQKLQTKLSKGTMTHLSKTQKLSSPGINTVKCFGHSCLEDVV